MTSATHICKNSEFRNTFFPLQIQTKTSLSCMQLIDPSIWPNFKFHIWKFQSKQTYLCVLYRSKIDLR